MISWLDGTLSETGSATVPADDVGLLIGDGVFETLGVLPGPAGRPVAFALTRHLRRLADACAVAAIQQPADAVVRTAVDTVLRHWAEPSGRVRITTTGSGRMLVTAGPAAVPPPTAAVAVSPWVRNERSPISGLKSTSYAENAYALRWARAAGYDEAVMANGRGDLCEGTGTNVFLSVDGRICTPPLTSGCLPGVTRELLLEIGVSTEQVIPFDAIIGAAEIFLTSSLRGVQPVRRVDERELEPAPGPLTAAATAAWADLLASGLDP